MAVNTVGSRRGPARPAILAALVLLVVGGAFVLWATVVDRSETSTSTVAAPQRLRIDSVGGDVTVTRSDGDRVSLERRLAWSVSRPKLTERTSGGTLELGAECAGPRVFFNRCRVSYTVRVPASVALEIHSGSGRVEVRDTTGDLTVRTNSGDVEVSGVSGAVNVETGSGRLAATGLGGDAVLRTGSGELTARWTTAPRSVKARTRSGDLTLAVPRDQYEVRGDTGDADIDVPSTAGAPRVIEVSAGSGDIRVTHTS